MKALCYLLESITSVKHRWLFHITNYVVERYHTTAMGVTWQCPFPLQACIYPSSLLQAECDTGSIFKWITTGLN